jgi:hypothetical protein
MNAYLCKEFSVDEISDVLFQIGPLKAPVLMASLQGPTSVAMEF